MVYSNTMQIIFITLINLIIHSLALQCPTEKDPKCGDFWNVLLANQGTHLLENSTRNCLQEMNFEAPIVNVSLYHLDVTDIDENKKVMRAYLLP